ncbi:hypothetical protein V2S66_29770 [Streptomyces sp. V4-01]|uniref:Uncharacterized protein n=1 Tax=Actinacidiphila polyblastidii TaxID=3110430 RepID=A0ABU7PM62_9ACTN|nr:hypothetical protein [Streptomyces sp. V4-01]
MSAPNGSAVRPEDVLPAGVDSTVINGVTVRKGFVTALVANAKALDGQTPGSRDHDDLVAEIRQLVPGLRAIGLLDVFSPRSPELARIIEETA